MEKNDKVAIFSLLLQNLVSKADIRYNVREGKSEHAKLCLCMLAYEKCNFACERARELKKTCFFEPFAEAEMHMK